MKMTTKMKTTSKVVPHSKHFFASPTLIFYLIFFWWPLTLTATQGLGVSGWKLGLGLGIDIKDIRCNCNLGNFYICLGNTWICRYFWILKIGLWTKINFSHVCSGLIKLITKLSLKNYMSPRVQYVKEYLKPTNTVLPCLNFIISL